MHLICWHTNCLITSTERHSKTENALLPKVFSFCVVKLCAEIILSQGRQKINFFFSFFQNKIGRPKNERPNKYINFDSHFLLSVRRINQHEAVRTDFSFHNLRSEIVAGDDLSADVHRGNVADVVVDCTVVRDNRYPC